MNWQQVLQGEADAAAEMLSIDSVSIAANDSDDMNEVWVAAREINIGDKFLATIGRTATLFGAFHGVGHIYVKKKHGKLSSSQDLEKACDRVSGWLCGRRGLKIGAQPHRILMEVAEPRSYWLAGSHDWYAVPNPAHC